MKLRLLLVLPLMLTLACSKKSKSDSGKPADPKVVDAKTACMNKVVPTSGREITADQITTGQDVQWKLESTDMFQSLQGNGSDLYIAVHANKSLGGLDVTRLCGGGDNRLTGNFSMKVPEIIDSRNGVAISMMELNLKLDSDSLRNYTTRFEPGSDKIKNPPALDGAALKVTMINENTLELWATFPMNDGSGTGRGVFRVTYRSNRPVVNPGPVTPGPGPITPGPGPVTPGPIDNGPTALQVFQQAYEFASSTSGLSLSRDNAVNFANKVSALGGPAGAQFLKVYKEAYAFLYSNEGASLSTPNAMKYADAIASTANSSVTLATFKDAYNFAYSTSGLNYGRPRALQFASEQAHIVVPAPNP